MPQNTFDNKSALVQVMTWCHQTTSHSLSQCWPRSMASQGHNDWNNLEVLRPDCDHQFPPPLIIDRIIDHRLIWHPLLTSLILLECSDLCYKVQCVISLKYYKLFLSLISLRVLSFLSRTHLDIFQEKSMHNSHDTFIFNRQIIVPLVHMYWDTLV